MIKTITVDVYAPPDAAADAVNAGLHLTMDPGGPNGYMATIMGDEAIVDVDHVLSYWGYNPDGSTVGDEPEPATDPMV